MSDIAKQIGIFCLALSALGWAFMWILCISAARQDRARRRAWLEHQERKRRQAQASEILRRSL